MKIYVINFDMFDGESNYQCVWLCSTKKKAEDKLCEIAEDYREFWKDFDIIDIDEKELCAYNNGCYDDAHISIYITEQEVE